MLKNNNFGEVWDDDFFLKQLVQMGNSIKNHLQNTFRLIWQRRKESMKQFDINFLNIL